MDTIWTVTAHSTRDIVAMSGFLLRLVDESNALLC